MPRRIFAFLAVHCLAAAAASAQTIPLSTLSGKVTAGGAAIPGVTVTIRSPNLQGARTVTTSGAGDYIVANLPPGDYTVSFELAGMQPATRRGNLEAARHIR